MTWQVQEAKQHFSAVVQHALEEGPQVVTRHGKPVVVIIAAEEYERLREPAPSFKDFLLNGPDFSLLDLERDTSLPREIDL
jgi:prevent-host-death family protein